MIELRWETLSDYEYVQQTTPVVMVDLDGLARKCVLQYRDRQPSPYEGQPDDITQWQDVPVDTP